MAVFDNLNMSHSSGVAPAVQDYYDKTVLHEFEADLVHHRDLQHRTLPEGNGKYVQYRKYLPYAPNTTPLKEGVTPDGKKIRVTEQWACVKPYGDFVEFTDELNLYTIDNVTKENAQLLARQARESVDQIEADALNSGMNVIYADANGGTNASRADIVAGTDILTGAHIKRAVRALEKANAQPFADGYFHAYVDPETKFDLTSDPMWVDIAKYQDKGRIEKYELGTMYKVKFFETTMTKVFKADEPLYTDAGGAVTELALNGGAWDATKKEGYVTVAKTTAYASGSEDDYAYLLRRVAGRLLSVLDASESKHINCLVDKVTLDGANIKFRLRYLDSATDWAYASGDKITGTDGGASDCDVHSTIVMGRDFAGAIELGGNGGNIQTILNAPGSSGSADPLAQRGSQAWKIKGFGVTILQDAYGVRIEHSVSA